MSPDITVIVPVYKVEPFIRQCLDSLLNQTKQEIEILLIDDGSPDSCGQICDDYARIDSRFTVIHQENQGLAETRNIGIEHAKAPYVMFVDSDDWVKPAFCERAYYLITDKNADIVFFGFERLKNGRPMKQPYSEKPEGYKSLSEAIDLVFSNSGNYTWNKIYRRELFEGIRYPKGRVYEDIGVTYQVVLKAKQIWYTWEKLYFYRYRKDSVVTTKTRENMNDAYEMTMQLIHSLQQLKETKATADQYLIVLHYSYCITHRKDLSDERYRMAEKVLMNIKPQIPTFLTKKQKIALVFFWYCRPVFNFLCIIFQRRIKL